MGGVAVVGRQVAAAVVAAGMAGTVAGERVAGERRGVVVGAGGAGGPGTLPGMAVGAAVGGRVCLHRERRAGERVILERPWHRGRRGLPGMSSGAAGGVWAGVQRWVAAVLAHGQGRGG